MRRAIFVALAVALPVLACGKKGMPPECEQYLVKYECYMTKSGMAAARPAEDPRRNADHLDDQLEHRSGPHGGPRRVPADGRADDGEVRRIRLQVT